MENFEKCTVAMLGGPCSQHVTGNTSRLNQPQSAIIMDKTTLIMVTFLLWIMIILLQFKLQSLLKHCECCSENANNPFYIRPIRNQVKQ